MSTCKQCRFWSRDWRCAFFKFEPPSSPTDIRCKNFTDKKSKK
jgi:hypothetical protein